MYKNKLHSVGAVLWIFLWCIGAVDYVQAQAQVGQTITLSVDDVSTDTYIWELYELTSGLDFAQQTGNCPPNKATFVGTNSGSSVQVKGLVAGTYFYKVTSRNKTGCNSNFKIGKFEVIDGIPSGYEDVLELNKIVNEIISKEVGGEIIYRFIITNNGTETLSSIKLSDPKIGIVERIIPDLESKKSIEVILPYHITQSDIDLGKIVNSAFVTAQTPSGIKLKDVSDNNTPNIDQNGDGDLGNDPTITILRGIEALPDRILYTGKNGGLIPKFNVLDNDILEGRTSVHNDVTIQTIEDDSSGLIVINTDGTISVAPNTPIKAYQLKYKICDKVSSLCSTTTLIVEVLEDCELIVYNGLSVNGDGRNDTLYIENIECYPNNILRIFNRWGVEVFNTEGYDNVTNVFKGISNGRVSIQKLKKLPQGTYYVVIEYKTNDQEVKRKGTWIYITTE